MGVHILSGSFDSGMHGTPQVEHSAYWTESFLCEWLSETQKSQDKTYWGIFVGENV